MIEKATLEIPSEKVNVVIISMLVELSVKQDIIQETLAMVLSKGDAKVYQDIVASKETALPQRMVQKLRELNAKFSS